MSGNIIPFSPSLSLSLSLTQSDSSVFVFASILSYAVFSSCAHVSSTHHEWRRRQQQQRHLLCRPQQLSGSHRPPLGREDWWSEEATATLIEAWGNRYVKLNHGNLRQNDWKEVSDAVNSKHSKNSRPKTDVQCKNRIDTLKKKYKTEKAKLSPSAWRFFNRLDVLIGPVLKKPAGGVIKYASLDDSDDDDDDDDEAGDWGFVARKHPRVEEVDLSQGSTCKELASAILKFGEVYERIEGKKQQMMIELEKQRMEVTKELELQRMNMLMEMQLELEKSNHRKRGSGKRLLN